MSSTAGSLSRGRMSGAAPRKRFNRTNVGRTKRLRPEGLDARCSEQLRDWDNSKTPFVRWLAVLVNELTTLTAQMI